MSISVKLCIECKSMKRALPGRNMDNFLYYCQFPKRGKPNLVTGEIRFPLCAEERIDFSHTQSCGVIGRHWEFEPRAK